MPRPSRRQSLIRSLDRPGLTSTRHQLVERFGQVAFDQARSDGAIVEVLPWVYANYFHTITMDTRIAAAGTWIGTRGCLSGAAACHLHGVSTAHRVRVTVVLSADVIRSRPEWLRIRRLSRSIPAVAVAGYSVATLPHALVQAWWDEGPDIGQGLIIDAVRQRKTDVAEIAEAINSYPRLTRRRQLTAFLERLVDGIDSFLEYLANVTVLNTPALRHLEKQVELRVGRELYRVDAYDRTTRTAIEFDGAAFHSSPDAQQRDRERDMQLLSIGVCTVRLTYRDVMERPLWCRQMICDTISSRRSSSLGA